MITNDVPVVSRKIWTGIAYALLFSFALAYSSMLLIAVIANALFK